MYSSSTIFIRFKYIHISIGFSTFSLLIIIKILVGEFHSKDFRLLTIGDCCVQDNQFQSFLLGDDHGDQQNDFNLRKSHDRMH